MVSRISFTKIQDTASWWKSAGGSLRVEIAALEPLLWRDERYSISDVVYMLKNMGFFVTMTTNGSTLKKHAASLQRSGLDLLRVSWHSFDAEVFRKITGGGRLELVYNGVMSAIDCNLTIKINRVLLNGYTEDLNKQIYFVNSYGLTLKVLDLYWTPSISNMYSRYYISPAEALAPFMDECGLIEIDPGVHAGRDRRKYRTPNNGVVEFKVKETAKKTAAPCQSCKLNNECLEGYGDYFRVFPNGEASLCYLRGDLSTRNYNSIFLGRETPLRLVLEGRCNFNCGFPTDKYSWCLKQGRGFQFPSRIGVVEE